MKYRTDIDGLRALAVLAVVLFHAEFTLFSGGFIGVDVFFVISGFLITKILVRDINNNDFTFGGFYEKRIRRILPAYVAMCLICALAALIIMPPKALIDFSSSLVSSAGFIANFYFAGEMDYFQDAASELPLLHMWSLSIEEQFYVLWPFGLLLIKRFRMQNFLVQAFIIAFIIISIGVTQWALYNKSRTMVFFFSPFRMWELMIGASLVFIPKFKPFNKLVYDIGSVIGLGLIVFPALMYVPKETIFPGLNALWPCLGAALIIFCGQEQHTIIGRLLSLKPIVFIGVISYSLYLWHWPIFAFANILLLPKDYTLVWSVILIGISFIVSIISWRYIEMPFRQHVPWLSKEKYQKYDLNNLFLKYGVLSLVMLFIIGGAIVKLDGLPQRTTEIALKANLALENRNDLTKKCLRPSKINNLDVPRTDCIMSLEDRDTTTAALWGDSHANAMLPAIKKMTQKHDTILQSLTMRSCSPYHFIQSKTNRGRDACAKFNQKVKKYLLNNKNINTVYISSYWSSGGLKDKYSNNLNILSNDIIAPLKEAGKEIIIIGQPPTFLDTGGGRCYSQRSFMGLSLERCNQPIDIYHNSVGKINQSLQKLAEQNNIKFWDTSKAFCDTTRCSGYKKGVFAYTDTNHLNKDGSMLVYEYLINNITIEK